jgi:hypothetical protein
VPSTGRRVATSATSTGTSSISSAWASRAERPPEVAPRSSREDRSRRSYRQRRGSSFIAAVITSVITLASAGVSLASCPRGAHVPQVSDSACALASSHRRSPSRRLMHRQGANVRERHRSALLDRRRVQRWSRV